VHEHAKKFSMSRSLLPFHAPNPHADVVELLGDCHARIRYFASLAVRLSDGERCPVNAAEAAARIRRYFAEAYPLHVADENESVLPRLLARAPHVAALVERIESEHQRLDAKIPELLGVCDVLERGDTSACCAAVAKLRSLGECMQTLLEAHMTNEESQIFPLLREHLTAEDVGAIRDEFRARRDAAFGTGAHP
jgi:hemerythrin-like domain-containing protein